jgi:hypothetical protein
MIVYHVFGHMVAISSAVELRSDHQDDAELPYAQYPGMSDAGAAVENAHQIAASGKGHGLLVQSM